MLQAVEVGLNTRKDFLSFPFAEFPFKPFDRMRGILAGIAIITSWDNIDRYCPRARRINDRDKMIHVQIVPEITLMPAISTAIMPMTETVIPFFESHRKWQRPFEQFTLGICKAYSFSISRTILFISFIQHIFVSGTIFNTTLLYLIGIVRLRSLFLCFNFFGICRFPCSFVVAVLFRIVDNPLFMFLRLAGFTVRMKTKCTLVGTTKIFRCCGEFLVALGTTFQWYNRGRHGLTPVTQSPAIKSSAGAFISSLNYTTNEGK